MSFTYDFTNAPQLSTVRLLVFDTNPAQPIFQDDEINAAMQIESSGNVGYPGVIIGLTGYQPAVPVQQVISYRRAAALLLRANAAGKGRNLIQSVLDVKMSGPEASAALLKIADQYIEDEMNAGYFAISEMVQDSFSMRERLWKMLYRTNNT
jgi:hypothetical protein